MKYFELAWTWYEDYRPYTFSHESKTKEEFESDVKALMVKYGPAYLEKETGWAGAPDWIEFVADRLPELGYTRIAPAAQFSVFGAHIIHCREGDDDDFEFGKIIGPELLQKAVEHNNRLENKLDGNE